MAYIRDEQLNELLQLTRDLADNYEEKIGKSYLPNRVRKLIDKIEKVKEGA